jgi:hypothetical protein
LPKFCPNFAQICRNYPVIRQLSGKKTGYPAGYPAIIRQKTDIRLSGYPVSGKNLVSGYPVSGKNLLSGYPVSGKKSLSGTPLAQTPKIGQKIGKTLNIQSKSVKNHPKLAKNTKSAKNGQKKPHNWTKNRQKIG